uniref:Uncharacterized protein n=1 Tax=Avena sativa TaxID=4498 RepID=A0ACD5VCA0_AVESA
MESIMKMGPCGGNGGGGRDMDPRSVDRIVGVIIHHGDTIDSVSVIYEDNGLEQQTGKWGGGGGGRSEIRLGTNEYFTGVQGHVGQFEGNTVVRSLTFASNLLSFGPYGREEGTPFTLPAAGGKIVGFHARSGIYLDAFGTYVKKD